MSKDIYRNITIDGDTYIIEKFTAMTGLKIARLLVAKAAPLLSLFSDDGKSEGAKAEAEDAVEVIAKLAESVTDEELEDLIKKCLSVCSKQYPAGNQPVLDKAGHYGVAEVEYDLPLTLRLVYEAVKFGASGFFGANSSALSPFKSLVSKLPSQSTSTPIFTPLS